MSPISQPPVIRQVKMRLSEDQVAGIVLDYQSGVPGGQIAERYGLARSTVIKLLRDNGVTVRRQRVSADDAALAVDLYRQGMRQIDIARTLGKHKSLVWHLLNRAGVLSAELDS